MTRLALAVALTLLAMPAWADEPYSLERAQDSCRLQGHATFTDQWRPGWEGPCKRVEEIANDRELDRLKAFLAQNDTPVYTRTASDLSTLHAPMCRRDTGQ